MHIPSLVKIHWYYWSNHLDLESSENMDMSWADNSVKNWRYLPISDSKPGLHNINAHTVWWKSIDIYLSYCLEMKIQMCHGPITLSKIDEICPLSIPNQICTISTYTPSWVQIHWYLLNLWSRNENTDWQTDGWTNWQPMWYHNTPLLSCGGV